MSRSYRRLGLQVYLEDDAVGLVAACATLRPDAVILDVLFERGQPDGLAAVRQIAARWPNIPVVVYGEEVSISTSVEFMRLGARDVLVAPQHPHTVLRGLWRPPDPLVPVRDSVMTLAELRWEYFWKRRVDLRTHVDRDVARDLGLNQADVRRILTADVREKTWVMPETWCDKQERKS